MANVKGIRLGDDILKDIDTYKLNGEEVNEYIKRAILEKIDRDKKEREMFEIRKAVLERGEN